MMCKQFLMRSHKKWQHCSHGRSAVKCHHVIVWYGNCMCVHTVVSACVCCCAEKIFPPMASSLELTYGNQRGSKRMLQSLITRTNTHTYALWWGCLRISFWKAKQVNSVYSIITCQQISRNCNWVYNTAKGSSIHYSKNQSCNPTLYTRFTTRTKTGME